MMLSVQASLKLIIAGNHDVSLDTLVLVNKLADNLAAEDANLVKRTYGDHGEARALLESEAAKTAGVVFLDEGNYTFSLANGASLSVYASPFAASKSWNRGLPIPTFCGRERPRMGHQAKHRHHHHALANDPKSARTPPTQFTAIDNDRSHLTESLASLRVGEFDTPDSAAEKIARRTRYDAQGCCTVTPNLESDQTLFVNAAIEDLCEGAQQHPWVVEHELPASSSS